MEPIVHWIALLLPWDARPQNPTTTKVKKSDSCPITYSCRRPTCGMRNQETNTAMAPSAYCPSDSVKRVAHM